ncbi:MAG: DNA replication/repair protein RecF [Rhodospirillales bacterium]|nr:DNA replication/repair protein RecF [Rhodospirillales bacterium]MCB9965599.1 DNA replication/repair protein RecF [Rhodospirillales bacterium]MCB9979839.1 DNA replication/repair protein RecF [Rhodospirillales bacterium]
MPYITALHLNHFRSYTTLELPVPEKKNIILTGPNGAGKTNILEALSLLSPGRGLRGAKPAEIQNKHDDKTQAAGWSIHAKLDSYYGPVRVGIGRDPETDKKLIHVNGAPVKTQSALGEWLSCLWLTPQMDRLFLDEKSARRRFFDRLIYTFDPAHMGRLTRYENALRQRMKLLKQGYSDPVWLTGIETQIAETGLSICATRRTFCDKLQQAYIAATEEEQQSFPQATLEISGDIETALAHDSALRVEDQFRTRLAQNRISDVESGTTALGPHRSDFLAYYTKKSMPAMHCSTGEQKALLIGIILAHARLLREEHAQAPLLLLDEIVAHLDPSRRATLSSLLKTYPSQVWMTGTDAAPFEDFTSHSHLYSVSESSVT